MIFVYYKSHTNDIQLVSKNHSAENQHTLWIHRTLIFFLCMYYVVPIGFAFLLRNSCVWVHIINFSVCKNANTSDCNCSLVTSSTNERISSLQFVIFLLFHFLFVYLTCSIHLPRFGTGNSSNLFVRIFSFRKRTRLSFDHHVSYM